MVLALIVCIAATSFGIPTLQDRLDTWSATEGRLEALRSLLLALGAALIGAAAIVSSLVLFAMQVNVERMPHGLFRRLSSDVRLLAAFAATFLIALLTMAGSLIVNRAWIGVTMFATAWGTILTLLLFLYGYRRALLLINAAQQVALLVARTRRELHAWARRAQRAAPLLSETDASDQAQGPATTRHDQSRTKYFLANPHWTDGATEAVLHAMALARGYAERGDYEVSGVALHAIIAINAAYVEAKGKTFYSLVFLFEHPLTSDGFITDTLEHLRQNVRLGVSRGDEQQIEQTIRAIAGLVLVYLAIDYATEHASKTHAHVAAAYLSAAVERLVPQNMADLLMEGLRLMGECAHRLLAVEGPAGNHDSGAEDG
jgi:hypothetical protein